MRKIYNVSSVIIPAFIFVFLCVRLYISIDKFNRESVQADFSAYYTAGQSLNLGLSPYKNNFMQSPPIWDGVARSKYSRFLYPPLVAFLFKPIALIPYQTAKTLSGYISLACLIGSLRVTANIFPLKHAKDYLFVGILISLFHPLLTLFERGQIDLLTLLLINGGAFLLSKKHRSAALAGGMLFAMATLIKLHCIYILPFIFLRKNWSALKGYVLGGLIISVLSILLLGWTTSYDYVRNQFPRISGLLDVDDSLGLAEKRRIKDITKEVPDEYVIKDGLIYKYQSFSFSTDASVVEPLSKKLKDMNVSRSVISFVVFGAAFCFVYLWQISFFHDSENEKQEYLYWQIPFLIILLTAPLTWTMNTVWVLPLSVFLFSQYSVMENNRTLLFLIVGFVVMMMDGKYLSMGGFSVFGNNQYIWGECFLIVGLMICLAKNKFKAEPQPNGLVH